MSYDSPTFLCLACQLFFRGFAARKSYQISANPFSQLAVSLKWKVDEKTAKQKRLCVFDWKCSHIFQALLRWHPRTNTLMFLLFIFRSCKCASFEEPWQRTNESIIVEIVLISSSKVPKKQHTFSVNTMRAKSSDGNHRGGVSGSVGQRKHSIFTQKIFVSYFQPTAECYMFQYECFLALLW